MGRKIIVGVYLSNDYLVRIKKWPLKRMLNMFLKEELGNAVAFSVAQPGESHFFGVFDTNNRYALEAIKLCKDKGISFITVSSLLKPRIVNLLQKEYKDFFIGSQALNERTSFLQIIWNKEKRPYLKGFEKKFSVIPKPSKCKDFQEAHNAYSRWVKSMVKSERDRGIRNVSSVDAVPSFSLMYKAGVNLEGAEIMPYAVDPILSSIRGAAKAYSKKNFMVWPAVGFYGGSDLDPLKPQRLRIAFYLSFMYGASHIFNESNHFLPSFTIPKRYNNKLCVNTRKVIRNFYSFTQKENRPDGYPMVSTSFIQGYLDGWSGYHSDTIVWGQENWKTGNSEKSWGFLDIVFPYYSKFEAITKGWFGGTPYGQVDLVPIETKLEILKKYKLLIFLGWNTMTSETYQKLLAYVRNGGCLFMSLAHTLTNKKYFQPGKELLFNKGDFFDLFGVRVKSIVLRKDNLGFQNIRNVLSSIAITCKTKYNFKMGKQYFPSIKRPREIEIRKLDAEVVSRGNTGQPVLIRKSSHGGGEAFLLLVPDYPVIYKSFVKDILTKMISYHQIDVRLRDSNDINFAVYKDGNNDKIYLLNTDIERPINCSINIKGVEIPLLFKPGEFKIIQHQRGGVLLKKVK